MNGEEQCWSCGEPARPPAALDVRLRREEGGGVYLITYRKARIRVPLCARCRKAWRPALRARVLLIWSLVLGATLVPTAFVMGWLMTSDHDPGTVFPIASGIGGAIGVLAVAVGLPAYRAKDRHPEGLRHPHSHPDVVALTDSGFGILN
ncbi:MULTISPECIES: hypothetical protein [unclassified Streptomyces]|uniref:hypothetical protein n=1 Tax=unclassified Streptomyces TaxID=2593676 RepID=UPI0011E819B8|nr:hypothetical protein [Streptomyces sp. sk2.1]TXS67526.1 hypothetical protein EAO76_32445 [Streptomyces sp. sk2.1]